jgi:hypothetical protein
MNAGRSACMVLLAVAACHSQSANPVVDGGSESGADATSMPPPGDDGGGDSGATDAGIDTSAPCIDHEGGAAPSDNCLFLGQCPVGCVMGTASAYACAAYDPTIGTFPSSFRLMADPVHVIGYLPEAGPWDGGAYVSCAPQACVRWALADEVEGGSSWPSNPCSNPDADDATQAWVCPSYEGFRPPGDGCFNAGAGQELGGGSTGMAVNVVWCCPPQSDDGGGEGGDDSGESDGSAPGDGAADDASGVDGAPSADGGLDASTE